VPLLHPAVLGLATATASRPPVLSWPASPQPAAVSGPAGGGPAEDLLPAHLARAVLSDDDEPLDLETLAEVAGRIAAARWLWQPVVRHDPSRRWYTRLLLTGAIEVWLIGWTPGQHTAVHDHGGALGALAVADGAVEEDIHGLRHGSWRQRQTRRHARGDVVGFAADHVHQITNRGDVVATTVHAYSPPELPLRYEPSASTRIMTAVTAPAATSMPTATLPVTSAAVAR